MTSRKRAPRRGEGHPRMTLDEAERQWHGPRRRHIDKHAGSYMRAFHRHLQHLSPDCLVNQLEVYDLAMQVRHELPCLCRPPFGDPSEMRMPAVDPTPEGDNRPPPAGDVRYGEDGWLEQTEAAPRPGLGVRWRADRIVEGTVVPVEHRGATLHFGERLQYMLILAFHVHLIGWLKARGRSGDRGGEEYVQDTDDDAQSPRERMLRARMAEAAMTQARRYVEANPDARIVGAAPPEPGMWDAWPPAQPTGEPRMDDGSHLLASERGRRRIDPVTGKRMIRTMVLTDGAWPHWEWSEDVEGPAGVGPWGPGVSFGTPEEPAQMSPRESMRGHLTRIGRLDLLHKYLPWPGDPPL